MGFRISTEVGRLALDMVWAEILVAALAGSAFYGLIALSRAGDDVLAPVATAVSRRADAAGHGTIPEPALAVWHDGGRRPTAGWARATATVGAIW